MSDWREMRKFTYAYCEQTIGKMKGDKFEPFKQEMKRLERIWRRDKDKWFEIVVRGSF